MSTNPSSNAAHCPNVTDNNYGPYSVTTTDNHSGPPKSFYNSWSIGHHSPTCCSVTATACCPPASLSSYTSSFGSTGPVSCAACSPDNAGPASENGQFNTRSDCSTDHKQPECGHSAAGQRLSRSVSCKRGNYQSGSMSTYSYHSNSKSVCTSTTKSSCQRCACCTTCCPFCVYEHVLYICTLCVIATDCWREATGAHSSSTCSVTAQ